jgi:hypothetical protein
VSCGGIATTIQTAIRGRPAANLPPHFHAAYGEHEAQIAIDGPRVLNGSLPPRALGLAMEWASIHAEELLVDWALASTRQPLRRIAPLG